MTPLIPRNTTIPTKKSEVFSTASDSQTSVEVHVVQGERKMASDNKSLGRFHLEGIPAAPRGVPQIEVTFDIDANGIVQVSALDKATNKKSEIRIEASSGLNETEIKRMVDEAAKHEEEDKRRKDEVDARNKLDSLIYNTDKMLAEHKEKIAVSDLKTIEDALEQGRKALEEKKLDEMNKASEAIEKASHKIAEVMYQAASAGGATGGAPGANGSGAQQHAGPTSGSTGRDGVIDAEFEESKN